MPRGQYREAWDWPLQVQEDIREAIRRAVRDATLEIQQVAGNVVSATQPGEDTPAGAEGAAAALDELPYSEDQDGTALDYISSQIDYSFVRWMDVRGG